MSLNNSEISDIFKIPPKEHHAKMISLIVVICACIAIIGYVVVFQTNTVTTIISTGQPRILTEQQKMDILSKLSSGNAGTMTEKQKLSVLKSLSTNTTQSAPATLSEQDKLNILQSLKK